MEKSYYAIIPANVRYDKDLTANAKLLYGEITALCNDKGFCWANNQYFASLYSVSKTSVSKWVSQLEKKDYIKISIIYKEGTKEILHRYISLVTYPIEEKLNTPIEEKLKDNNTVINNTINNTEEDKTPSEREIAFNDFWDRYAKKHDKEKCQKKFMKLPQKEVDAIFEVVDKYVAMTPDRQYRKNPLTWLNGKNWKDEDLQGGSNTTSSDGNLYEWRWNNSGGKKKGSEQQYLADKQVWDQPGFGFETLKTPS